jgi:hypothetical protein
MKRRQVLAALGAAGGGGTLLTGSGAFTSARAERGVEVSVVSDADAFMRLAPCTDDNGDALPNGDYVTDASTGAMTLDLSSSNGNINGNGVSPKAFSVFDNVFEICNNGSQPVCVDFKINAPTIPSGATVPTHYDFGPGDPAVVFYRADNRNELVTIDQLDTDRPGAIALDVGDCQCVGLEVRAFGFDSGDDLFANVDLAIRADAGAGCVSSTPDPVPQILGPTDGLLGYWPLDSVGDGTAEDVVGGNDGTPQNGVSAVTGQVDNAATFDGSSQHVTIPSIQVAGSLSVAAWVKRDSSGDWHAASSQGNNTADTRNWWLGGRKNSDQVHWSIFDQSTNQIVNSSHGSLPQDTFTHVIGTYDEASGEQQVYIDGQPDTTGTPGLFTPATSTDSGAIGAEIEDDGTAADLFDGTIDDVRVYDRALSDSEVQDLYDATK